MLVVLQVVWQVLPGRLLQQWQERHKCGTRVGWWAGVITRMGGEEHKIKVGCALLSSGTEKMPLLTSVASLQYTLATDCFQLGYNEEGHCKGEVDSSLPRPQKLNWEIPPEVIRLHLLSKWFILNRYYRTQTSCVVFKDTLQRWTVLNVIISFFLSRVRPEDR